MAALDQQFPEGADSKKFIIIGPPSVGFLQDLALASHEDLKSFCEQLQAWPLQDLATYNRGFLKAFQLLQAEQRQIQASRSYEAAEAARIQGTDLDLAPLEKIMQNLAEAIVGQTISLQNAETVASKVLAQVTAIPEIYTGGHAVH